MDFPHESICIALFVNWDFPLVFSPCLHTNGLKIVNFLIAVSRTSCFRLEARMPVWYHSQSVRILQRSRTNRQYIHIYKEIYYKELVHTVMEAESPEIYRVSWQAGGLGEPTLYGSSLKAGKHWTQEKPVF